MEKSATPSARIPIPPASSSAVIPRGTISYSGIFLDQPSLYVIPSNTSLNLTSASVSISQ